MRISHLNPPSSFIRQATKPSSAVIRFPLPTVNNPHALSQTSSAVQPVEVADQNPQSPTSTTSSTSDHLAAPQSTRIPVGTVHSINPNLALSSQPESPPRPRPLATFQHRQEQEAPLGSSPAPRHSLGRRRRSGGGDSNTSISELSLPGAPPSGSTITEPPRKKRRSSGVTMLANADSSGTPNGRSQPYANGNSVSSPSAAMTTNGTLKSGSSKNGSARPRSTEKYYGHDREEVTRLLIQALSDMGYHSAAQDVSQTSGYELEGPIVAAFRTAILEGNWVEAEELLDGTAPPGESKGPNYNRLVLANGADRSIMKFWIRQQKYLELLEQSEHGQALMVLRNELTSLYQNTQTLHFLSSLMMCHSKEELRSKAEWDGAEGLSRQVLLSELSKCISPSVMLPEHRLAILLHQVKDSQIGNCFWHSSSAPPSLYSDHSCNKADFPTETVVELDDHAGEVWQVVFSHDGTKLASCGSDKQVIIWEVPSFKILFTLKEHSDGVGNVAWSWDDSMLVTCCRDHYARIWDMTNGDCIRQLERFGEPASSCVWIPDNSSFITSSFDKVGSIVQWSVSGERMHDLRGPQRVEELAISPDGRWLVAMDCEKHIHVFNFVTKDFEYKLDLRVRLTSLSFSHDSRHLLVNQTNGCAQLIDLVRRSPVQQYVGHKGGEFIIRATLGGANESFVISGSEDGTIHIWHKGSGHPIEKLPGHSPRCNSVAWCPTNPRLFASCGDDGKVKIWSNDQWRWAQRQNAATRSSNV
ncbi:WD40 repeat-like protein [Xylaria sp. CBS 124048]|nr:WD40 repeat-like protein [Xylaria sp. CBS 124048]